MHRVKKKPCSGKVVNGSNCVFWPQFFLGVYRETLIQNISTYLSVLVMLEVAARDQRINSPFDNIAYNFSYPELNKGISKLKMNRQ
jgi:hypothetical protein